MSVEIFDMDLPPASTMIGVIKPPGMLTATEMSARLYWRSVSPAKETLHCGTLHPARRASALISMSLTDKLDASARKAGIEFAAQLEQRIEPDIDSKVDVRCFLHRLAEPLGDRLAHAGQV